MKNFPVLISIFAIIVIGLLGAVLSSVPHVVWLIAGLTAALLALLALFHIRWLPALIFTTLVVGQLLRVHLSTESASALLLIDIANAMYVGVGLIYLLVLRKKFVMTLPLIFLLGFFGWAAVSLVYGAWLLSSHELLIAIFYALRLFLMGGAIFVTVALFPKEKDQQLLMAYLLRAGVFLTLLGFIQLVVFPNFAFMTKFGWDPHVGRLLSTFFDPNFFGFFLAIIFSFYLVKLLNASAAGERLKAGGLGLLVLAACFLTFSRSAYLALLISLFIILAVRSWKLVLIALLALLLIGGSIPRARDRVLNALKVDTTAQDRIQSWVNTLYIVKDHPVIGVGYNAFGPAQIRYGERQNLLSQSAQGSDSSLLLILATTGIVGLFLYLAFWFGLLYEALLLYRFGSSPFFRQMGLLGLGIIPAYLVHSQFVNSLVYPLIFVPFTFFISTLTIGATKLARRSTS